MKINRLDDLIVFIHTAESGSFSAAARRLHMTPAFASAAIKRLEDTLGVRLFERSTRRLRLNEAGERYLPYAVEAVHALKAGESTLLDHADSGVLSGSLRIAMPSDLGRSYLMTWLDAYLQQIGSTVPISALKMELRVSDRLADLLEQPIDVAIRYGVPADSGFIALPLAPQNRRVLCAAPEYLARFGVPRSLADLTNHNCLRFMLADRVYSRWRFDGIDGKHVVEVQGDRIADDADIVRRWAVAGLGIAYKSHLDVVDDLKMGRLQRILPDIQGEHVPLVMLVVSRNRLTSGLRHLAKYLALECQKRAS